MPTQARTFQGVDRVLSLQNSSSRREQRCCPSLGSQSAFPPARRPSNLAPTVHTQPRCQSANHDADGAEKPDHQSSLHLFPARCIFSQLRAGVQQPGSIQIPAPSDRCHFKRCSSTSRCQASSGLFCSVSCSPSSVLMSRQLSPGSEELVIPLC